MGTFQEYSQYDAMGLAELVKKREISPAEICEEAIVRIEKVNPQLNAVVTPCMMWPENTLPNARLTAPLQAFPSC